MTIGTAHDAALAYTRPPNFFLDEGSERMCFLIRGVVYKVNHNEDEAFDGNLMEWDNYRRLSGTELPPGIRIPEMSVYNVNGNTVVAAQFVSGLYVGECNAGNLGIACDCDGTCFSDSIRSSIHSLNITDIGYTNVVVNDDGYWLIDLEG